MSSSNSRSRFGFLALGLLLAGCSTSNFARHDAYAAEKKAVAFLSREVPAWSRVNGCFSCHNNGDGARALYVASRKRHHVPRQALEDTTRWLRSPARWHENKGDPGFSDQRLANLQFATALAAAVEAGAIQSSALQVAADRIVGDQAPSGEWPLDRSNPVGSPATYGSTLATFMALSVLQRTHGNTNALARACHALGSCEPNNTVSAAALLLAANRGVNFGKKTQAALNFIVSSQKSNGGWGPYPDSAAEPFDTALTLLALKDRSHPDGRLLSHVIDKARGFLVDQQLPDGSWPATTRPPGNQSYAQQISTTAWATIALLETR